jgi:hypothetical protein
MAKVSRFSSLSVPSCYKGDLAPQGTITTNKTGFEIPITRFRSIHVNIPD